MSESTSARSRHAWATAIAASTFLFVATLPWAGSGSRGRSPFTLRDSAVALDLYDGVVGAAIEFSWPFVPLAVGGIWGALFFSRRWLMRTLGAVVALIGLATAWAIWRSPLVQLGGLRLGVVLAAVLLILVCVPIRAAPVPPE